MCLNLESLFVSGASVVFCCVYFGALCGYHDIS